MRVSDVGVQVLDFLYQSMGIDDEWAVREPRSFTWWGHRLAQRVTAEPVRLSRGYAVVRVHAVTAVARAIPRTGDVYRRLAVLNRFLHLSALVRVEAAEAVVFHTAACFHAENVGWLQHLFLAAVGLQVADAHVKADSLARVLRGEVDESAHPGSGPRRKPDALLSVIETVFAREGGGPSPWREGDFNATVSMTPRPWVLATGGADGMTAEFAFTGERPAIIADGPETALFTVSSTERHPQLGSGLLLRLELPFNVSVDLGSDLACTLNVLEATSETSAHTLGAWCLGPSRTGRPDGHSIVYVSFLPAAVYRKGLLDALAMAMAVRTRWLVDAFIGGQERRAATPEQFAARVRAGLRAEHAERLRELAPGRVEAARQLERPSPREEAAGQPEVACWSCRAPLPVTAETRGKKVRCPRCGTRQLLPR